LDRKRAADGIVSAFFIGSMMTHRTSSSGTRFAVTKHFTAEAADNSPFDAPFRLDGSGTR